MGFFDSTPVKLATYLTAGAAVTTGVLFLAYTQTKKKKTRTKEGSNELSRTQLLLFYTDLSNHMQRVVQTIKQQVMQILQSEQAANIAEEEIFGFMTKQLTDQMATAEKQFYQKHGTTQKAVKAAVAANKDDPNFQRLVEKMKALNAQCRPRSNETKLPDGFDEEKCVKMLGELVDAFRTVMGNTVNEFQAAGIPVQPQLVQMKIAQSHQEIVSSLSAKYGFPPEQFDPIISQFKDSKRVQACVEMLAKLPAEYGLPSQLG